MSDLGNSGIVQTDEEYLHKMQNQHFEREDEKERRRLMTNRLYNWAAWYGRNHHAEIERSSGQIRENSISRLMRAAGARSIADRENEDPREIDNEDAVEVYEAVKMLEDPEHVAILQYRFLDCYEIKQIAQAADISVKTVKRRQQKAIDALILKIGKELPY